MLALFLALLCVLANGFFVGAEFALAKVRPTALEARAKNDPSARRALAITQNMAGYLSATQLGITLASLTLGKLGEPALAGMLLPVFERLGWSHETGHAVAATLGMGVISALHIIVGELVPKSLALQRTEDIARWAALPLSMFYWVSYPALVVLSAASRLTLRLIGLTSDPHHNEGDLSLDELRLIIRQSVGEEDATKGALLERVLRATDRPVRSIMVPRIDMEYLSVSDDVERWIAKIRKQGFSRYPVTEGNNPDKVVGYVYAKDLIVAGQGQHKPKLEALRRDILIVPEARTVGEILAEFQKSRIPIALVVDEYGGTSGLVTLEDAVTEIVGELNDEVTSITESRLEKRADGTFMVDGSMPLADLDAIGFPIREHPDADTLSGYIVAQLDRLARPGDVIEVEDFVLRVADVRARRINRVHVTKAEPKTTADESEG